MGKIIITGAGSGLGAELAKKYSEHGYSILLVGRTLAKLDEIANEILESGGEAECIECDVSDALEVESVIGLLTWNYSDIDMIINNVGIGYFGMLESMRNSDISSMIDTNVKGTIYMTRAILPYFKHNNKGKIINIISTAGLRGKANESVYVASKYAIRGFTESLQKELENDLITVTAVYLGGMNTPFWGHSNHVSDVTRFKSPKVVAELIYQQDDGREAIYIDR
ncbi:MAG: SDR family NAD(P)-dependent oxidoreductase [Bacillota bacterium]|jgi:short-subunit dehydrogenase|nr:SDR family NAD(P)-dependent oxidoreductase [Bacillota bacterium]